MLLVVVVALRQPTTTTTRLRSTSGPDQTAPVTKVAVLLVVVVFAVQQYSQLFASLSLISLILVSRRPLWCFSAPAARLPFDLQSMLSGGWSALLGAANLVLFSAPVRKVAWRGHRWPHLAAN